MSSPRRYLTRMSLFVVVVALFAAALYPGLSVAFLANPVLNGVIFAVLVIGIIYTFRSVLALRPEVEWLESFQGERKGLQRPIPKPRLLAPMASMLGQRQGKAKISALALRSLLDGVAARMAEGRELSRYLIGLLIFLGLLGTFWGLLDTVSAVGDVINDLTLESGDLAQVFADLQTGLEAPLGGMGTAFSSSLFGLSGSLVLGFLELQASQAQNRFFNELEDWMSGNAQVSSGGPSIETGEGPALPTYMRGLIEQTAENLDKLQRVVSAGEEQRRHTAQAITALADRLAALDDHLRTQQSVMVKLASQQAEMRPAVGKLVEAVEGDTMGMDQATRAHIRTIATALGQMKEELADQRSQTVQDINHEIRVLARTIAALAEEEAVS